jgi:hypothetical protein
MAERQSAVNGSNGAHLGALIARSLRVFVRPGEVVEVRIPRRRGAASGYFDDLQELARAAAGRQGSAGIYFVLNPVNPALLARACNRVKPDAEYTTSDRDVTARRWLFLDFDSPRPAGISSTDAEHEASLWRARECRDWLRARGWPAPVTADSGNGGHLHYRIDLPNDDASTRLLSRCLQALDLHLSDDVAKVDVTTFNAARICKLYGTAAAKGDSLPDRPQWLELHKAGTLILHRLTREPKRLSVRRAAVSITGTIQPAVLAAALDRQALQAGLGRWEDGPAPSRGPTPRWFGGQLCGLTSTPRPVSAG